MAKIEELAVALEIAKAPSIARIRADQTRTSKAPKKLLVEMEEHAFDEGVTVKDLAEEAPILLDRRTVRKLPGHLSSS